MIRTLSSCIALTLLFLATGGLAKPQLRAADLIASIEAELTAIGVPAGAAISIDNPAAVLTLAHSGELEFADAAYDRGSGRFVLHVKGAEAPITGAALKALTVPVPARDIARGAVIANEDLAWAEIDEATADAIQSEADLIGAQARRTLRAGKVLSRSDILPPKLVRRGVAASMVYAAPGLRVSQAVVPQGDGARGDVIEVKSQSSGRLIKALVVAAGEVAPIAGQGANMERRP